ncbi:unnamed protein product [Lathyrus sativus]|nr:unnamed protein product [Lathyrus sativus]
MFPKILLGTPHPSSLHLSLSPATTNSNEKLRPYPSSSSLVLSREPNILGSEQHCLLPLLSRRNQNDNAALEPSRHNSSATTCF